ncbi:putative Protein kinase domain-containing protein [Seiridium cardinale]
MPTNRNGSPRNRQRLTSTASEVRAIFDYFHQEPTYSYERILGKGAYGIACLLQEFQPGVPPRKFVVKRGIWDFGIDSVKNEVKLLEWLIGASHIIQKIALSDIDSIEEHLPGPTLITEYLRNGTLSNFIERLGNTSQRVPNRLLWRLFLCSLAFPPGWPTNVDLAPETWPDGTTQDVQITHNDMHSENVAFGDFTDEKEHDLSPILKILDFGSARVHDLSNPKEKTEFKSRDFDATDVFFDRKDVIYKRDSTVEDGDDTHTISFGGGTFNTLAIELFQRGRTRPIYPNFDGDLAILVARCVSDSTATQPDLKELVGKASEAVRTRTSDHYLGIPEETDDQIRTLVQQLLHNADVGDRDIHADYEIPQDEIN